MNGRVVRLATGIVLAVGSAAGLSAVAAGPAAAVAVHSHAGAVGRVRTGMRPDYQGPYEELVNEAHGLCLDAASSHDGSNGDTVQLWSCSGASNQMWRQNGSEWQNEAHNLCLAAPSGDTGDGDKIELWSCTGAAYEQWVDSNLVFTIQVPPNYLVLDAASSADGSNGDKVQLWSYSGAKNQQWYPN